ncbi:helix-turn-helix transcriptional regulator [Sandaracinobacter neustonicus]|uniref:Helix-turn-helix transcriptional regulator n=1 Tax=Sandaracinobacter neustonicus TaxID=1715348 RepID=A0A501XVG2_9SPHN|nr:helix-turn-helix domain-containing protein [Sandaracinobacter neustonicus]TPE64596.1 helix-turn-helix transcriptional regulator [Sandaracinobacter neustonicus]
MKWTELEAADCSLARALSAVGDRWTLLILRDAFLKVRRFEAFEASLGISRRTLTERLEALVAAGIFERRPYQEKPLRHEYRLTEKGLGLYPALLALIHWGDEWVAGPEGPPVRHRHKGCGQQFRSVISCSECGEPVTARDVIAERRGAAAG